MSTLWILHRDERLLGALARLAGAGDDTLLGAPGDPVFDAADAPQAVVMGLTGDFERELEFAHRVGPRLRETDWILLVDRAEAEEARRLFDTLRPRVIVYPPSPGELRGAIDEIARRRRGEPLSERRARDTLAERFARWFADLEVPDLLRSLDPHLSRVPLLVRGEPGTGRHLLARYVHVFGGTTGGFFVHVPCSPDLSADDVLEAIAACARRGRGGACALWLQDVDTLPIPVQRRVHEWVEFWPPEGSVRAAFIRWMGGAGDVGGPLEGRLDPGLERALSGLSLRIPPLRARPGAVEPFVEDTARAWCASQGERQRHFSPEAISDLQRHPWPGNLSELEALVERTLSATAADPIPAGQLRFEAGGPLAAPVELSPIDDELEPATLLTTLEPREATPPRTRPQPRVEPKPATPVAVGADDLVLAETELVDAEPAFFEAPGDDTLQRLVGAVAHEVRNPLVAIRTLAQLLPERWEDPEFRERFSELVDADVERIEGVVRRLSELSTHDELDRQAVDVVSLLESLLEERREDVEARRLLVLKELDYTEPFALADAARLRDAFEGLLSKTLELLPERGDLFLASKHHAKGLRGGPTLRVLVRFRDPRGPAGVPRAMGVSPSEASLDFVLAEAAIRAQGGILTIDTSDADETLMVVDLPAPG